MIAEGYGAGTVAIARQQSAGRGQRGRVWQSLSGGLYLSLAIEPDWPVSYATQLTCISAWGIATALNNLGIPIQIKWPNDLFFEGKKLGGILTETKLAHTSATVLTLKKEAKALPYIKQAVIGIGINWHNSTPATGISLVKILERFPTSLANIKINCLEMLGALVLKGILQGVFFQRQVGSQVFMKGYEKLLTQFGKPVSLDRKLLSQIVFRDEIFKNEIFRDEIFKDEIFKDETLQDETKGSQPRSHLTGSASTNSSLPKEQLLKKQLLSQLLNRSGEIVGLSEEGYLKVALRGPPIGLSSYCGDASAKAAERILLFAPAALKP